MASLRYSVLSIAAATVTACASAPRAPLTAETSVGTADGRLGKVLVLSTNCGSMETLCRSGWAETVDGIVIGSLEFHGYTTIDPATLRKDDAARSESILSEDSTTEHESRGTTGTAGVVAIFPMASVTESATRSVSVSRSKQKTVVVTGATFEDLRPEDRQQLLETVGAETVLSTRLVVGANYQIWTSAQFVQVMVKLSDARSGSMRFAARCTASSADFADVNAAIDAAARCAANAITRR